MEPEAFSHMTVIYSWSAEKNTVVHWKRHSACVIFSFFMISSEMCVRIFSCFLCFAICLALCLCTVTTPLRIIVTISLEKEQLTNEKLYSAHQQWLKKKLCNSLRSWRLFCCVIHIFSCSLCFAISLAICRTCRLKTRREIFKLPASEHCNDFFGDFCHDLFGEQHLRNEKLYGRLPKVTEKNAV